MRKSKSCMAILALLPLLPTEVYAINIKNCLGSFCIPEKPPSVEKPTIPINVDERWLQKTIKTHPDYPYYPNKKFKSRVNLFDWRTQHIQVGMANLTGAEEFKVSPFYICEVDSFYNIPGGKLLTTNIMGPDGEASRTNCARSLARSILNKSPDMNPDEGWEIVKFNLGYKMEHYLNAKKDWSADGDDSWTTNQYPYIILYNRLTAKLRVLSYFQDYNIGTGVSVTLSLNGKAKIFNTNQSADAKFYNKSVSGFGSINNSVDGGWGVADFHVELDPCSPGYDIDMVIDIQPKAIGNVELYGHSIGISQNITDDNIGDPKKYLMNVSGNTLKNLNQAGSYTVNTSKELRSLFVDVNDSATADAVASDAFSAAGEFLASLMEMAPGGSTVVKGLQAISGSLSGVGSIFGTQAAAVSNFSPIIPQISFSEIYLRGETTLADPGIKIKLTVPGSRSTAWKDLDSNGSSSISYPLYDEPMGLFTLLTTPRVHVHKTYTEYNKSNGYKVTTTFKPSNVALVSNTKSGLDISGWGGLSEKGISVTGRLKIKYLVESNITPTFENLNDIDGDNRVFGYVDMKTNGMKTKLYTVVTDEVPLMHLSRLLGKAKIPSITVKGGVAVVDNVSLVVTAKNNSSIVHDGNINRDIKMISHKDSLGTVVPYYLVMKEYPATFSSDANVVGFNPNADIDRLISSGQVKNISKNPNLGVDIRLGRVNSPKIEGYCSSSGEYNKNFEGGASGRYSIIADEDMRYNTGSKKVSSSGSITLLLDEDTCFGCFAERWGFISFNLREYISKYGYAVPKKVTLQLRKTHKDQHFSLLDYNDKYIFSANKPIRAMIENSKNAPVPKYSSKISYSRGSNPANFDVKNKFIAALKKVNANNDSYDLPRISFSIDNSEHARLNATINTSESTSPPRLIIDF